MKVRPKRKPIKWPDGARIAITPCVAFETWPEDLGGPNTLQQENRRSFPRNAVTKRNLAIITDREFGERVGIYRMLEIFEQEKIQTSFFPTGITVQNYPEIFKEIAEQGHEVGTETWIHDYSYMKKREKEKKDLQKTVDAVKKVVGKAPVGYLSTGVAPSAVTPEIIIELGYTYWMDPQHQETPYTLKLKKQGTDRVILFPRSQRLLKLSTRRQNAAGYVANVERLFRLPVRRGRRRSEIHDVGQSSVRRRAAIPRAVAAGIHSLRQEPR